MNLRRAKTSKFNKKQKRKGSSSQGIQYQTLRNRRDQQNSLGVRLWFGTRGRRFKFSLRDRFFQADTNNFWPCRPHGVRRFLAARTLQFHKRSGIAKFTFDIDKKSTTIWLWIVSVQHLRLCPIPLGGRWSSGSPAGLPLCMD